MPEFQVDSYKVSSSLARFRHLREGGEGEIETRPGRGLEMIGPVLAHGIRDTALFGFSSQFNRWVGTPYAGHLTIRDAGLTLLGWFPIAEFSEYYHILRGERPVQVFFEYGTGETFATETRSGYLSKVGLKSATGEIVGEGPRDSST